MSDARDVIVGKLVTLRPSRESDRRNIFSWLAESDATSAMLGPPLYHDAGVPTWDEFNADYGPGYFDGRQPEVEASYIIEIAGEPIGQVNYEALDRPGRPVEIDIWLRSLSDTGHGYGSDALRALTAHLTCVYGFDTFVIRPSARNPRAIRAYEKAGFEIVRLSANEQSAAFGPGDYDDSVVMIKHTSQS